MDYGHRYGDSSPPSMKQKIRSSICFSCCFRGGAADSFDADVEYRPPSLIRTSSTWIRSKANEIPEIKERCRTLISRMGKNHRRSQSGGDFRYDPLSYALNFDEGNGEDEILPEEEFRYRNFSSRLPASPPRPAAAASIVSVACS